MKREDDAAGGPFTPNEIQTVAAGGVQFAVCDMATHRLAGQIAKVAGVGATRALAAVAAASVLYSSGPRDDGRPPGGMSPETYGSLLVMQTSAMIGPDQSNRALR